MVVTVFLIKKDLVISYTIKVTKPATGPVDVEELVDTKKLVSIEKLTGIKKPTGIEGLIGIKKPIVICHNHQY